MHVLPLNNIMMQTKKLNEMPGQTHANTKTQTQEIYSHIRKTCWFNKGFASDYVTMFPASEPLKTWIKWWQRSWTMVLNY